MPMASGADAGRIPQAKSPTCRSLPSMGGPALAICADSTIRTVSGDGRIASAAPRSRMIGAITSPVQPSAVRVLLATPQPDPRGVDRLLSQRAESLALKGRFTEPHLPAHEERLQAVVGGAREEHAAQDLAPLVGRQRRLDRRPPQEAVTGVADLLDCLRKALAGDDARGRVAEAGGRSCERRCSSAAEKGPRRSSMAWASSRRSADGVTDSSAAMAAAAANGKRSSANSPKPRSAGGTTAGWRGASFTPAFARCSRIAGRTPRYRPRAGRRSCGRLHGRPRTPPWSGSSGCGSARRAPAPRPCSP